MKTFEILHLDDEPEKMLGLMRVLRINLIERYGETVVSQIQRDGCVLDSDVWKTWFCLNVKAEKENFLQINHVIYRDEQAFLNAVHSAKKDEAVVILDMGVESAKGLQFVLRTTLEKCVTKLGVERVCVVTGYIRQIREITKNILNDERVMSKPMQPIAVIQQFQEKLIGMMVDP